MLFLFINPPALLWVFCSSYCLWMFCMKVDSVYLIKPSVLSEWKLCRYWKGTHHIWESSLFHCNRHSRWCCSHTCHTGKAGKPSHHLTCKVCPFITTHWAKFSTQRLMVQNLLCFCIWTGDCEYKWRFNRECICESHVQWTAAGSGGEKYSTRPQDHTGTSRSKVAKRFKAVAWNLLHLFIYGLGVQVELLQEKTKTGHNIWKPCILRGTALSQQIGDINHKSSSANLDGNWDLKTIWKKDMHTWRYWMNKLKLKKMHAVKKMIKHSQGSS